MGNAVQCSRPPYVLMAENIYSKGTKVWFPDKELSWISGEVTSLTRNPDDTVKLVFVDDRGKVPSATLLPLLAAAVLEPH